MKISDYCNQIDELREAVLVNEQDFDYLARNPSECGKPVCVYVSQRRFLKTMPETTTMVITTNAIADGLSDDIPFGLCVVENPKTVFFSLFEAWVAELKLQDKPRTRIGKCCNISSSASIPEYGVVIGDNVTIEENVTINENVNIGDGTIIHAGSWIGDQDFNYLSTPDGWKKLTHAGRVEIGRNVEISRNTGIGRALYPQNATVIGDNCIIGINCGIGHDTRIGNNVMLYSAVILGGFVEIGNNSSVYLSATVKNGVRIGKAVKVGMGSCVFKDVPDGVTVFGNPARAL